MIKGDYMDNKTIRELSISFNISKEAIYKKINYTLKDELKNHVIKQDKKTYITPEGQNIIFQSLKKEIQESHNQINNSEGKVNNKKPTLSTELNSAFDNQILDLLNTQVINLTQQINNHIKEKKELIEINKSLVDTLNIKSRIDAGTLITNQHNFKTQVKEPFFKRIFKF